MLCGPLGKKNATSLYRALMTAFISDPGERQVGESHVHNFPHATVARVPKSGLLSRREGGRKLGRVAGGQTRVQVEGGPRQVCNSGSAPASNIKFRNWQVHAVASQIRSLSSGGGKWQVPLACALAITQLAPRPPCMAQQHFLCKHWHHVLCVSQAEHALGGYERQLGMVQGSRQRDAVQTAIKQ